MLAITIWCKTTKIIESPQKTPQLEKFQKMTRKLLLENDGRWCHLDAFDVIGIIENIIEEQKISSYYNMQYVIEMLIYN